MRWLLADFPFWIYRVLLSPALHLAIGAHGGCRFEPTCSRYAEAAIRDHGFIFGGALAARRLCSCHPFSKGGFDPVPQYGIGPSRKVSENGS